MIQVDVIGIVIINKELGFNYAPVQVYFGIKLLCHKHMLTQIYCF